MKKYFIIELPVFGQLGNQTTWTSSSRTMPIDVHYEMDFKPDSDLFQTFPIYIASHRLASALIYAGFTGFEVKPLQITSSKLFRHLNPGAPCPNDYVWLAITGQMSTDDFAVSEENRLFVSHMAFAFLQTFNLTSYLCYDAENPPSPQQIAEDKLKKFAV